MSDYGYGAGTTFTDGSGNSYVIDSGGNANLVSSPGGLTSNYAPGTQFTGSDGNTYMMSADGTNATLVSSNGLLNTLGSGLNSLRNATGMTTQQLLGTAGVAGALIGAATSKPADPVAQSAALQAQARAAAHTPISVTRGDGTVQTFDPYGSMSVTPTAKGYIPMTSDLNHAGETAQHVFYNQVNPLYSGASSVWDPSVTGANQAPTHQPTYTPPPATTPPVAPTQGQNIAQGTVAAGSTPWWQQNPLPSSMIAGANTAPVAAITPPAPSNQPLYPAQTPQPRGYAVGGLSHVGQVPGQGSGQADDVNAKLSSGEFVIPADVVSHLGDGSTDAGANQLYQLMHSVRTQKGSSPKNIPPPAKPIAQYLKGGK